MTNDHVRRAPADSRRDTVEQMLNEVPGATAAEAEALLALFAAATGPFASGELSGEAAAVAAFRAAQPTALPVTHRVTTRKRSFARLLTVKAAAAAVVVTSMGGVALASTTGLIPTPLTHDSHKAEKARQQADRAEQAQRDAAAAKAAADKKATSDKAATDKKPAATPELKAAAKAAAAADRAEKKAGREHTASFAGLCNAYSAGSKGELGKAPAGGKYKRLVQAAADAGATVESFCATLAAETASAAEDTKTTTPGKSAEHRADGQARGAEVKKDPKPGKSQSDKAEQATDGDAPAGQAEEPANGNAGQARSKVQASPRS